jgi:hypothetical protein
MIMQISNVVALIIGGIIAVIAVAYLILNQKKKVIEWLKWAVSEAEKMLGGGTGQLKLRLVYDWFVQKFPVVAAFLPFRVFSAWVDTALETLKKWLDENKNVANYIEG